MSNRPAPVIISPQRSVRSAVIWMHGLGADAHDFESIVPLLPTEKCSIRMVFPNAEKHPVTINGGYVMPAWYDISDVSLRNADKEGIAHSTAYIHSLIDEQIAQGIPSENIVIAGFSQGGAMAIHAGLRYPRKLAGIMALSCYVLERNNHNLEISKNNQDIPVWIAHGTHDNVVPYELGESSAEFLRQQGHKVTFMSYPMAHEVCMPEITALSEWLGQVLNTQK